MYAHIISAFPDVIPERLMLLFTQDYKSAETMEQSKSIPSPIGDMNMTASHRARLDSVKSVPSLMSAKSGLEHTYSVKWNSMPKSDCLDLRRAIASSMESCR